MCRCIKLKWKCIANVKEKHFLQFGTYSVGNITLPSSCSLLVNPSSYVVESLLSYVNQRQWEGWQWRMSCLCTTRHTRHTRLDQHKYIHFKNICRFGSSRSRVVFALYFTSDLQSILSSLINANYILHNDKVWRKGSLVNHYAIRGIMQKNIMCNTYHASYEWYSSTSVVFFNRNNYICSACWIRLIN